jgi:bacillopeptidase F (M6 metalloprotease family)
VWVEEEVDLSAYAGRPILLRFEYVTDDAVNYPGWLIDDVSVAELAYFADFETDVGGWQSEGWLLTDNTLPQGWLVQVIDKGLFTAEVRELTVGDDGCGQMTLDNVGRSGRHTLLVVSAVAPLTTEEAQYVFDLDPE